MGKTIRTRKGDGTDERTGPTLADIARAAGVSTATVSRVLNAPDSVRPVRAERVRQAIAELGYLPDGAARALASRRSMTVGAVIPTLDNAIFAHGIEAFQARLVSKGYSLILASSAYDLDTEAALVETLLQRRVDALMLVGLQHHPALIERLRGRGVPHVLCWAHDPSGELPCVGFDNRQAAALLTRHLTGLGHRRIAMIAGLTTSNDRARERVEGVRLALSETGGSLPPDALIEVPYSYAEGRAAMARLLARPVRPSAVICGNDVLAIGALLAARDAGLDVPGDISVTGFDDLPLAGEFAPALTTVRVPAQQMGEQAAARLIADLEEDETMTTGPGSALDVTLVIRDTTGPVQ